MDASRVAQRFPLVARARPACSSLDERVREVSDLARAALDQTGADSLRLAATAHNKAALIASDCGVPDLARSLCWRQFDVYLRAQPLGTQVVQYALEPVVNLARLLIRSGDGEGAYRLLDTLYQAVRSRTEAVIDGQCVPFQDLTGSDEDHRTLCRWLWTVLLGDGTRALVGAGRWDQALARAEQRGGVGRRLLDGRQVAILARCLAGDPDAALMLLDESALSGYRVHFARDLVWKPVEEVWALLTEGVEPRVHEEPPLRATNGYVAAGPVTAVEAPHVLEYQWRHDGAPVGRVRWEITHDPLLGTRVELTQTLPGWLARCRATALAAWHVQLELFFAATHGQIRCPWPQERTEELRQRYTVWLS